jgi:hypothetical protein
MSSITAGGIRERLKNKARNGFITVPPSIYLLRKINQLLLTHIGGSRTTLVLQPTKNVLPAKA